MDSRTRLLNAPLAQRRLAAILLPLALAAVALGVVFAGVASVRAQADALADKRERLGRLRTIVASMPARAGDGLGADAAFGPEFLQGDNDALMQAAFQSRLREIVAMSGAEVLAVGNTPIVLRGDARFAGLRTSISGPNEAIVQTIFAIETSEPYMTIRTAHINAYPGDDGDGQQQLLLQVQFEGALPTAGEAAGETAVAE